MFLTYQQAKIDQFGLFGLDPSAWSYVEHTIHRPWFYVATTEAAEDFEAHPMLLLTNEDLLASLLESRENLRVTSVMLVTPAHVNELGRWAMEPLETIERYTTPCGYVYAYGVEGGNHYLYGDQDVLTQPGVDKETIYSMSML